MHWRSRIAAATAAGCALVVGARGAEPDVIASWERLERPVLVAAVLERNPTLEAARQAWRAATEHAAQAGALEQPRIAYGFAPLSIGSGLLVGQEIELSLPIPSG